MAKMVIEIGVAFSDVTVQFKRMAPEFARGYVPRLGDSILVDAATDDLDEVSYEVSNVEGDLDGNVVLDLGIDRHLEMSRQNDLDSDQSTERLLLERGFQITRVFCRANRTFTHYPENEP